MAALWRGGGGVVLHASCWARTLRKGASASPGDLRPQRTSPLKPLPQRPSPLQPLHPQPLARFLLLRRMHVNAPPSRPKPRHSPPLGKPCSTVQWQRPWAQPLARSLLANQTQPLARLLPSSKCSETPKWTTSVGTPFSTTTRAHAQRHMEDHCVFHSKPARSLSLAVQWFSVALFFRTAMNLMMGRWSQPRQLQPKSKQQTTMRVSRSSRPCVRTVMVCLMCCFALPTGRCPSRPWFKKSVALWNLMRSTSPWRYTKELQPLAGWLQERFETLQQKTWSVASLVQRTRFGARGGLTNIFRTSGTFAAPGADMFAVASTPHRVTD